MIHIRTLFPFYGLRLRLGLISLAGRPLALTQLPIAFTQLISIRWLTEDNELARGDVPYRLYRTVRNGYISLQKNAYATCYDT